MRDGYLTSTTATRTYITEDTHTVRVVSLVTDDKYLFSDEMGMYADGPNWQVVSDPDNLVSDEKGIMVKGPNALAQYPYGSMNVGANFWMDWEYPVHVEIWEPDGTRLVEQDGSFKLNGQYSRALDQKSFAVYARSEYGDEDRFYAPLFSDREYTDYKSFVLRCTGQDYNRSRMRDAMITGTMEGQDVMYQETEVCVLYLNGEYWGHYNMRERICAAMICQYEGWEGQEDEIDIVKGNDLVLRGSADYNYYKGITDTFREERLICNLQVGCKLFRRRLGEVTVGVNDLFDQNGTTFRRTVTGTTLRNVTNLGVGRYVSLQLTYNLRLYRRQSNAVMDALQGK